MGAQKFIHMMGPRWSGEYVPSRGRSGGIVLMWKREFFKIRIVHSTRQSVNATIQFKNDRPFLFSGIYASNIVGCNNKVGKQRIWARLDRAPANLSWSSNYDFLKVKNLSRVTSDHSPVLLNCGNLDNIKKPAKKIIFEHYWFSRLGLKELINNVWDPNVQCYGVGFSLQQNLSRLAKKLIVWNKESIGNLENSLADTEIKISFFEKLDEKGLLENHKQLQLKTLKNLSMALKKQILIKSWTKSRERWIDEGDKNTSGLSYQNLAWNKINEEQRGLLISEFSLEETGKALQVLANRLRPLLSHLIDKAQSAFISERCIHDNIVTANELVNSITMAKGRYAFIMIRLDLEKAFGRVSWASLLEIMKLMNFPITYIRWV
ncbi:LINE-1 reverse transcriptase-like [Canna indica]|uniref:LINE-1 reverse transcriptase-like n=1 Tax=Canna indica TaxID=4628 RepID=A0AAQ3K477_9LILI|nr:LINE-1 reverse transcriptase-like [Canna indica]